MGQSYPVTVNSHYRVPYDIVYEYCNGGSYPTACTAPVHGVSSGSISYDDSVVRGASPSDWRKLIALGSSATSPLQGTKHTRTGSGGSYSYYFGPSAVSANKCVYGVGSGDMAFPQIGWPSTPSLSPSSLADALARKQLLDRYLAMRKTWRGGNFLVEFAETVHMLKHPISSLFGSTMRFARQVGGISHLQKRKYAAALGNLWIAYSFGVKPLFEDIRDANAAINRLRSGTGADTMPISAHGSDVSKGVFTTGNIPSAGPLNMYAAYDRELNASVRTVRYYGAIRARPESFATVADSFGVSLGDILPAVWEAIPWSFFVDYFLNVQEVIDSMQYASADFAWMNRGFKNTTTNKASGWYSNAASIPISSRPEVACGVGGHTKSTTFKNRGAIGAFPAPSFRFKIPGMTSLKWVNTAALVAQIAGSKPAVPVSVRVKPRILP